MLPKSPLPSDPLWYKDAVFYELHVKAFFDSNHDGIGDFRGLLSKLDYLESLGVNCLWLLPFYPSPLRDDGYDISDYLDVHPSYGTRKDVRDFIREAHRRGLRVVTELVVNHTSDQHPWFQRARRAPKGSPERDFYVWSDDNTRYPDARIIFTDTETSNWTWDPVAGQFYWHRFFSHQPDLNYDNPRVLQEVKKILKYWLDLGVDGVRLDAVPYLVERDGTTCENLPETHAVLRDLRAWLDAHYRDRMFLAESNQWPSDVIEYFGKGDECHMAFHFPLMPRLFMALSQEDRHPITDIMRQTPPIPDNCQWGIFLRNHDELTLEMVTDEERDYMFRTYAMDPRMRVNIGIRRRLAPLMEHSRPRIELLNSILFSFPGTPILYYGDEIGMGDNIYLGDRNGVRTPMQWSGDRNAGFSRADFAKLYSPPIMDPVYGYQAINVEAQERDPSSLLNWMKRMIALRRANRIFGRGSFDFLFPVNRKVLAYVRRYEGETVLCVANLSRHVQPVELNLKEFRGCWPVEMLGGTPFPRIGDLPYFLTLGPYAFYWFRLSAEPVGVERGLALEVPEGLTALPLLSVPEDWRNLVRDPQLRERLEREVLPLFLRRQRWFASKGREGLSVRVLDAPELTTELPLSWLALVEASFAEGEPETYFVPLGVATGPGAEELFAQQPACVMARLEGPTGFGVLHDAMFDDVACKTLFYAFERNREIRAARGMVTASQTRAFPSARKRLEAPLTVGRPALEQSNTSVTYGRRMILKVFRRLQPGRNPELEVGRFLTEDVLFGRIPRLLGALEYHVEGEDEPRTLGVLQDLVPHQVDSWKRAVEEITRYFERVMGRREILEELAADRRVPSVLAKLKEFPEAVRDTVGVALQDAATLGRRTAELHLALASRPQDPLFAPEPAAPEEVATWAAEVERRLEEFLEALRKDQVALPQEAREEAARVLSRRGEWAGRLARARALRGAVPKIRTHGDFHLGQVLWSEGDYVLLDFEGEPHRSLAERRAKKPPLRDVAGMLRSFHYAASVGLLQFAETRPEHREDLAAWAEIWARWTSAAFLREYFAAAEEGRILPQDSGDREALLFLFLLEKVLYEVDYERGHRPKWLVIPLRGILALLAETEATSPAAQGENG